MPSHWIPYTLFQTASDADLQNPKITNNIRQLRENNPEFDYRFMSHDDAVEFVHDRVPSDVSDRLRTLNPGYNVIYADLFRYYAIYEFGGVYLDIKSNATQKLTHLIGSNDQIILSQWNNKIGAPYEGYGTHSELRRIPGGEFMQWFVIAKAKHPILAEVIDRVCFNIIQYSPSFYGLGRMGVLRTSGPIAFSTAIAPMLPNYQATFVDIDDSGLVYSIYGDNWRGHQTSKHYSGQTDPVFPPNANGNPIMFGT